LSARDRCCSTAGTLQLQRETGVEQAPRKSAMRRRREPPTRVPDRTMRSTSCDGQYTRRYWPLRTPLFAFERHVHDGDRSRARETFTGPWRTLEVSHDRPKTIAIRARRGGKLRAAWRFIAEGPIPGCSDVQRAVVNIHSPASAGRGRTSSRGACHANSSRRFNLCFVHPACVLGFRPPGWSEL
jgi:hypothetical protein